jgi:hypothetical protein
MSLKTWQSGDFKGKNFRFQTGFFLVPSAMYLYAKSAPIAAMVTLARHEGMIPAQ